MKELDGFTVEQLNDFIKSDHTQCGDVAALARIALAAKRAEPVTWWTGPEPTLTGELESYHDHETGSHYLPLVVSLSAYNTTPQLNSQVPLGSWIKCSDQMPEDDTLCLGVDECGVIWTMHFDDGEFRADTGDVDDLEISHWMPLPAAPEKPL
ncbi:DUF551 domain-containing protein [Yersinia enterocolitica]|nr:DUF551 domain-containing protein [Yersinia enterocolitica]